MSHVVFTDKGYDFYDRLGTLLFSEEQSHLALFDYLEEDLSPVSELIKEHCRKRINLDTLEILPVPEDRSELEEAKKLLSKMHPYLEYENAVALARALGNYVVSLALYRWRVEKKPVKAELEKILTSVIPEDILKKVYNSGLGIDYYIDEYKLDEAKLDERNGKLAIHYFENEYKKRSGEYNESRNPDIEEIVKVDYPRSEPVPLESEMEVQKNISNMIYFILDVDAKGISKYPIERRMWLYANIFDFSFYINEGYVLCKEHIQEIEWDKSDRSIFIWRLRNLQGITNPFERFKGLQNMYLFQKGIPESDLTNIQSIIDVCSDNETVSELYRAYKIDNLRQLLTLEVIQIIQSKNIVKKCSNCGRYFIAKSGKNKYCRREDESGKTCAQLGPNKTYQKKVSNDKTLKLYYRVYKKYQARHKNKKITDGKFCHWIEEAQEKLAQTRSEKLSPKEFELWLNEQ